MTASVSERLVETGKLAEGDLRKALLLQQESGEALSKILTKLGLVSERDLAEASAQGAGLKLLSKDDYPTAPVMDGVLSNGFLREARVLPIAEEDDRIIVAMTDPGDQYTVQALQMAAGREVEVVVGVGSDIEAAFEQLYGEGRSAMGELVESIGGDDLGANEDDIASLRDMASEAPVVRLVNLTLTRAVDSRASDIHIEPFENHLRVRYRIDGVMREVESPPSKLASAVISRIKLMAKLNIAERRLPQDGRIQIRVQGKEIDLRVSTVPTMYGESVVMRILDREAVVLDFESSGFREPTLGRFINTLEMPYGIIVVTGPTGSGKSTTLYTALQRLNTPDRKILTVEDPVEYQLDGVNQIQVKPAIDLTFANALRSIVRQDPDVIMIGEMRDRETAGIAVQSALTGHVVLSTLHTNDAAGGITRLLDMGVEDYLLTSTINGILGQRLVRKICPHCREAYEPLPEMVKEMGIDKFSSEAAPTLYKPVGCEQCNQIGYMGRTAVMEFLVMSDEIRRLVIQHAGAGEIEKQARKEGMLTMYEDGLVKALDGMTTVEEVLRVTQAS